MPDLDFFLAATHHIAVFSLVAIYAAEFAMLRPGLAGPAITQLARIDAAYGAVAGIVVVVGIVRVIFGAAGWQYYVGNQFFWAKMAAFVIAGLLTIPPTLAIRRWANAGKGNAAYEPSAEDIARQRRFIHLQAGFLLLIPVFAAAMARGYGS